MALIGDILEDGLSSDSGRGWAIGMAPDRHIHSEILRCRAAAADSAGARARPHLS